MRYTLIAAITARIMNQINLDALLRSQATVRGGTLSPLKLQPDLSYQATLGQGHDGQPQLQINTPQGIAQVSLTQAQAAFLTSALTSSRPLGGTTSPQPVSGSPIHLQLTPQLSVQLTASPAVMPATDAASQGPQSTFQLQLTPQADGQLLLQPQAKASTALFAIAPAQLLKLLQPLAAQPQGGPAAAAQLLPLPVSLERQDQQLLLTLSNQRQVLLPLQWLPAAAHWPAQTPMAAQLLLQAEAGQLQLKILLTPTAKSAVTAATAASSMSPPADDVAGMTHKSQSQTLTIAQSRQLLPTLVAASQTAHSAGMPISTPLPAVTASPAASLSLQQQATPLQWRLLPPAKAGADWQLQVDAGAETATTTTAVKVDSSQFNRPLQWQAAASPVATLPPAGKTAMLDVAPLWRQLLPLSQPAVDPLRLNPELPPAVQAVLTEIRQHSLDSAKAISSQPLLQQQLTAALQFNPQPLLSPAATPAAAATLALAIQLLLGRLSQLPQTETKTTAGTKLQQLIAQLEPGQSSQLLRQLAGHASTMQGAQLATLEQQQQPGQSQQLFIQLPLLQQGDSRFAELALTEREADGSTPGQKRTQWQLTMKFDLASQGKLLVQVRLTGLQVSLQFYTEQAGPLAMAQQFLPLLKDRLKMQGLEVTEAQCQLGKIPPQLYQRNNSLLAVKV